MMTQPRQPYIYLLTDIRNGKQYVGKSCGKYYYFTGGDIPNNIINKYGKSTFIKEILEEGDYSNEFLNALEKHYIKVHDTFNKGYNLTIGGDDGARNLKPESRKRINESKHKVIYMFDLEGNQIDKFKSIKEALIKFDLGLNSTKISKCLHSNVVFNKMYRFSFNDYITPLPNRRYTQIRVLKNGEIIGTFKNKLDAADKLGIDRGSIYYFIKKGFSKKHNLEFKIL